VTSSRCVVISKVLIIYVVFGRIISTLIETSFRPMLISGGRKDEQAGYIWAYTLLNPYALSDPSNVRHTRVGTLIVATIYLQLIQNRYMFRSFTVLQCSHQHCVQPVASDVEVVGYL